MTTIVPDQENEEGQKLAAYQPGETVRIEFNVVENTDGQLGVEVTLCELVAGEEAMPEEGGEFEEEAAPPPTPAPAGGAYAVKKKVPNAVVIAVGSRK